MIRTFLSKSPITLKQERNCWMDETEEVYNKLRALNKALDLETI
jgi:hypothetical protein